MCGEKVLNRKRHLWVVSSTDQRNRLQCSAIVEGIADGTRPCKRPVLGVRAICIMLTIEVPLVSDLPGAIVKQELVTNSTLDGRDQDRTGIDFVVARHNRNRVLSYCGAQM
jgi:hypothetical protein